MDLKSSYTFKNSSNQHLNESQHDHNYLQTIKMQQELDEPLIAVSDQKILKKDKGRKRKSSTALSICNKLANK